MEQFLHDLGATSIGVGLAAWWLVFYRVPNPARIPLRKVLPRALAGLGLFFVISEPFAYLADRVFVALPWIRDREPTIHFMIAVALGIAVPHFGRLSNVVVRQRLLASGRGRGFIRAATVVIETVDEATLGYVHKIILREEMKAIGKILKGDRLGLDRLYEFSVVEVARDVYAHSSGDTERRGTQVLPVLTLNDSDVKAGLLLRFLGYSDCMENLVRGHGVVFGLFPTWPSDSGDRRKHQRRQTDQADVPASRTVYRRKCDNPYVHDYVQGNLGYRNLGFRKQ